jgi:hypothetical protein
MAILNTAPEGANVLDLGAARAARAEVRAASGQSVPLIKIDAGFIEVRPEIDLLCAEDFVAGKFHEGLAKLLVDPADIDVLLADGLSKDDLEAITTFVTGTGLGE